MSDNEKIDDYELINCVATGSATQIWEVNKSGNTQPLAMKLLLEEKLNDSEAKRALKHEATIGKLMEHPGIINIYDFKLNKKVGYFTMEFFRAGNLKSLIRSDLSQAQARAKKLMESLSQALAYFHEKGWIHRDIKPDNVLLNKGGEVRLIDFSLSSKPSNVILRAVTQKKNIVIQGTRTYLAPELIRREALTPAADIYSLGVTLYETLLGNPPFRTANPNDLLMMHVRDKPVRPSELDDNITPELDDLVLRMLAKKVKDRPESMQALFAEVRSLKFFKEDPVKVHRERQETIDLSDAQANEDRLNSRRDAGRDRSLESEKKPQPKPKPKVPAVVAEKPKPAQPPQQQPQMPGYPPQTGMPFPGYPGMQPGQMPPGYPMPGYSMPGYPGMPMAGYPGMMMPGMPPGQFPPMAPGQFPPGYPQQPGMAPYPGMLPPQMPQPGGPVPQPGQPVPNLAQIPQPAAPVPIQPPQPTPPVPVPQAPKPVEKKPVQDLPLATFDDLEIE